MAQFDAVTQFAYLVLYCTGMHLTGLIKMVFGFAETQTLFAHGCELNEIFLLIAGH